VREKAKCTLCGATQEVDSDKATVLCWHCVEFFPVKEAIVYLKKHMKKEQRKKKKTEQRSFRQRLQKLPLVATLLRTLVLLAATGVIISLLFWALPKKSLISFDCIESEKTIVQYSHLNIGKQMDFEESNSFYISSDEKDFSYTITPQFSSLFIVIINGTTSYEDVESIEVNSPGHARGFIRKYNEHSSLTSVMAKLNFKSSIGKWQFPNFQRGGDIACEMPYAQSATLRLAAPDNPSDDYYVVLEKLNNANMKLHMNNGYMTPIDEDISNAEVKVYSKHGFQITCKNGCINTHGKLVNISGSILSAELSEASGSLLFTASSPQATEYLPKGLDIILQSNGTLDFSYKPESEADTPSLMFKGPVKDVLLSGNSLHPNLGSWLYSNVNVIAASVTSSILGGSILTYGKRKEKES